MSFDIEGVMTDGLKHYTAEGFTGMTFHTRDSFGIELLLKAQFEVAFISTAKRSVSQQRAQGLGVRHFFAEVPDKGRTLVHLQEQLGLGREQTLHMGDDLWDLGAFEHASVRVTVPDAVKEVRRQAHWVTRGHGGRGAVREVADALLRAQGLDGVEVMRRPRLESPEHPKP